MEAESSAPAGPSGSGGVRGAGEVGIGVAGRSAPMASVSTSAKDDVKAFNLEKFSGEDWASWSFRMELLFNHYGLLEVMDGELKRPASEGATKEWDRRSKDGFFLLSQCLSSNQLHHIKHLIKEFECGPKAWKILKDVHAPSSKAMVVVLERHLHAVKINDGDAVQGAFDQLRDLYVKLSAAGVDYPEKIKCYKALSLLPESWGPLVVNLNGMKDSWSLEWIRAQVLQEEFQRKELTAAAGEGGGSAYSMKGLKGRGSKKGKAKEGSGGEQHSGGKRGNKGGKRCGVKCWYCHVEGHPWFKCRKLPDGWRPSQPSIEGSKGVHGAMGEGMGSEEGDGGAGGYGGMFYHVGEACPKDMVEAAARLATGDVRGGRVNHVENGGGGDDSDGGLLGHGGAALPSVTPSTGAEGEAAEVEGVLQQEAAPVAKRGAAGEEVQQPTPSPSLPPRRTTQGKHGAVRGGAKEGAAKERPKKAAHPRDFLKYERLGGPKALL
ncbi:unnamed protein product [Closterium sp. NIES-64]|nr:unnamed protein product [Closterium sp. NIES-64]